MKTTRDALKDFTFLEVQRCSIVAGEVSGLGDVMLVELVQQLIVINQLERQKVADKLELLILNFIHISSCTLLHKPSRTADKNIRKTFVFHSSSGFS